MSRIFDKGNSRKSFIGILFVKERSLTAVFAIAILITVQFSSNSYVIYLQMVADLPSLYNNTPLQKVRFMRTRICNIFLS